jgi:hypothetical protein
MRGADAVHGEAAERSLTARVDPVAEPFERLVDRISVGEARHPARHAVQHADDAPRGARVSPLTGATAIEEIASTGCEAWMAAGTVRPDAAAPRGAAW